MEALSDIEQQIDQMSDEFSPRPTPSPVPEQQEGLFSTVRTPSPVPEQTEFIVEEWLCDDTQTVVVRDSVLASPETAQRVSHDIVSKSHDKKKSKQVQCVDHVIIM